MESGEPDFQIAPMIDVLLVMLIFFMTITSAQVLRVDKNIQLPTAPNASRKDTSRAEAVLNVRWEAVAQRAVFTFQDRPFFDGSGVCAGFACCPRVGGTPGQPRAKPQFSGGNPSGPGCSRAACFPSDERCGGGRHCRHLIFHLQPGLALREKLCSRRNPNGGVSNRPDD
jgi:Biopolymer transport protein ExbD/TolR